MENYVFFREHVARCVLVFVSRAPIYATIMNTEYTKKQPTPAAFRHILRFNRTKIIIIIIDSTSTPDAELIPKRATIKTK